MAHDEPRHERAPRDHGKPARAGVVAREEHQCRSESLTADSGIDLGMAVGDHAVLQPIAEPPDARAVQLDLILFAVGPVGDRDPLGGRAHFDDAPRAIARSIAAAGPCTAGPWPTTNNGGSSAR